MRFDKCLERVTFALILLHQQFQGSHPHLHRRRRARSQSRMKTDCSALSHQCQVTEREKAARGHTRACISEGATTSMERRFVTTENDRPSNFSPTVFFFSRLCLKVADFCPSCTRRTCGMANVARCPPPPSPKARSDEHNVRKSQTLHCALHKITFYLFAERILQL